MIEGRIYRDRTEAGRELADLLRPLAGQDTIVYGLVRGGLEVAAPIASELRAPLEPLFVRKVGHPRQPELAVGAIAPDGELLIDPSVSSRFNVEVNELEPVIERERAELARRVIEFTGGRAIDPAEKTAIVVDDGLATGSSALAAGQFLRRKGARTTVLAIPVCPPEGAARMRDVYDQVICLQEIASFQSVGQWYLNFRQLDDADVRRILSLA